MLLHHEHHRTQGVFPKVVGALGSKPTQRSAMLAGKWDRKYTGKLTLRVTGWLVGALTGRLGM